MEKQYLAFYKSKRTSKMTAHQSFVEAQMALLRIPKAPKNPDIRKSVKVEIKNYSDLVSVMRELSQNGSVDGFVLPVTTL